MKLADLGSCFNAASVDTGSLGLEMQSLPYRSPEVWLLAGLQPHLAILSSLRCIGNHIPGVAC